MAHERPRDLEREIERTRMEMDETIDELSERLSFGHLTNRAKQAVLQRTPGPPQGGHRFYAERPLLIGGIALGAGIAAGFLLSPTGGGPLRRDPTERWAPGAEARNRAEQESKRMELLQSMMEEDAGRTRSYPVDARRPVDPRAYAPDGPAALP